MGGLRNNVTNLRCKRYKSPKWRFILLSAGNAGGIPVAQVPLSLAQPGAGCIVV